MNRMVVFEKTTILKTANFPFENIYTFASFDTIRKAVVAQRFPFQSTRSSTSNVLSA